MKITLDQNCENKFIWVEKLLKKFKRLYLLYPARYPLFENRNSVQQGGFQILALVLTLGMSIAGGLLSGFLMRLPIFAKMEDTEDMLDDEQYWHIEDDIFLTFQKYGYKENLSIKF